MSKRRTVYFEGVNDQRVQASEEMEEIYRVVRQRNSVEIFWEDGTKDIVPWSRVVYFTVEVLEDE